MSDNAQMITAEAEQLPTIQLESSQNSLMAMISAAAQDPSADVEKMERLMQMYERITDKQSESVFNEALNKCQSEIGRVAADKTNSQTSSDYASYAAIDRVIRPAYSANGFSLSFDTEASPIEDHVTVVCYVAHSAGHTRRYSVNMPADGKGAKGGNVMTKTHAFGSATQYGMRYLVKMIFNIAIGEDDDGNGAGSSQMGDDLIAEYTGKIRAETSKEAAKAHYVAALKICKSFNDVGSANILKGVLVKHGEKIESIAKSEQSE